MHTYLHTYIHTYNVLAYAYVRTYVHTYIHAYIQTFIHTYINTSTFIKYRKPVLSQLDMKYIHSKTINRNNTNYSTYTKIKLVYHKIRTHIYKDTLDHLKFLIFNISQFINWKLHIIIYNSYSHISSFLFA